MARCRAEIYGPDPEHAGHRGWHPCGNAVPGTRSDGYCHLADSVPAHRSRAELAAPGALKPAASAPAPAVAGVAELEELLAGPVGGLELEIIPGVELLPYDSFMHVGSMNPADKWCHGASLEGNGLSVSFHPEAWREIARLGEEPTWRLERAGARFLDVLASEKAKDRLFAWALEHELVEECTVWLVRYFDEELEQMRTLWCTTEEEALDEIEMNDLEGVEPEERQAFRHTSALSTQVGRPGPDPMMAFDDVCIAYARAAGLDGVWWEEPLNVPALSAPRGVILPERVAEWVAAIEPD